MDSVVKAKNNFRLVQATVDWVDTADITKDVYKTEVENMNLGKWFIGRHAQFGVEFLELRENVWLHSGSIIGTPFMLKETYQDVGGVNPRFHDFDATEQKLRIAQSYGAAKPGVKKVISVINLGHHWGAFYVDVTAKKCFVFDPMQLGSNISTLKSAVGTIIERILDMTDQLQYEVITGCTQKDGSSCGLWSLVVLELLLFGANIENWNNFWSDTLYNEVGFLRVRYLHKIITLQECFSTLHDGVDEGGSDE
ncbi:hypothetical protein PHMEG_00031860 [Phytophthora megakarya]|uniref:Ubiquitin-like protease family profile domain-containing protein n=1 Tax=Phytophthora megakarya TaxID=4795 RepID=A0A225UXN9_9STRA|nr:hypothetical protein PHMEG_00031860 [Phytophthora megakarya]